MTDREIQRKNFEKDIFGSKIEVDLELYLKLELSALKLALEEYRNLPRLPPNKGFSSALAQERLDKEIPLRSFVIMVSERIKTQLERAIIKMYDRDKVLKTVNELQCCFAEMCIRMDVILRHEGRND